MELRGMKWQDGGKLHNGELHGLYASPSMIRMVRLRSIRWIGYVSPMGERNACRVVVGLV